MLWQKYRLNSGKKSCVLQETREDSDQWLNAGPNTTLTASIPLPNSSFGLHTRVPPFPNVQNATNAPMQYPSTNYFTVNNNHFISSYLANLPYTDSFHHQQQQFQHQQYTHSSLQSGAMDNTDFISNPNAPIFDSREFFLEGSSNFDTINRH